MNQQNRVTTQFISDQPTVLLLKQAKNELAAELEKELINKSIQVQSLVVQDTSLDDSFLLQTEAAYKVIFQLNLDWWLRLAEQDRENWISTLRGIQSKLVVIFPVNSVFNETFPGEIPFWKEAQAAQTSLIELVGGSLPNAIFLFGLDVVNERLSSTATIVFQKVQQGLIFVPQMRLYFQSCREHAQRAIYYALRPQRRSVLIRGQSNTAVKVAQKIKQRYESYHFSPLELQFVDGVESSPMIFSVVENVVNFEENLVEQVAGRLPSPNMSPWPELNDIISLQRDEPPEGEEHFIDMGRAADVQVSQANGGLDEKASQFEAGIKVEKARSDEQIESDELICKLSTHDEAVSGSPHDRSTSSFDDPPEQPKAKSRLDSNHKSNFDVNSELHRIFTSSHVGAKKTKNAQTKRKKISITRKSRRRTSTFYGGLAVTGLGLGVLFVAAIF